MGNIRLWNKDREVLSEIFALCDTLADLESVKVQFTRDYTG